MTADHCTICGHAGAERVAELPPELHDLRDQLGDRPLCAACATGEIPSPCVNACRLDGAANRCLGCGRAMAEVVGWGGFRATERAAVWRRLRASS